MCHMLAVNIALMANSNNGISIFYHIRNIYAYAPDLLIRTIHSNRFVSCDTTASRLSRLVRQPKRFCVQSPRFFSI